MRRSKFSPQQIAKILKEFDNGKSVDEISREHGVSSATFYNWRSKFAGMNSKELKGSVALILFKVKILILAITILKICSNITVFQNRSFYKPFISN